ncbi:tetratricopeptide repeat domain protein [Cystobacter fuscus DSM 2262]|uniref:Tetratricopeptide repeat domain protein n=1 Tax=Cystobacter fuscus (strain ATCC 25194 / DSM 2262 / NBRC 100088 / M29) TaxID=1242864 RepID=S9PFQ2_CYSF2|nr:hypothetical protein [Cystobacter fuscus]EPX61911.1 tetratricopeptide repeat domain protein [Cystobacter fuscus DSM 2262]
MLEGSPESLLYLAPLAFADEHYAEAAAFAEGAAQAAPEAPLPRAAAAYLARVVRDGKRNVYVSATSAPADNQPPVRRSGGNNPFGFLKGEESQTLPWQP